MNNTPINHNVESHNTAELQAQTIGKLQQAIASQDVDSVTKTVEVILNIKPAHHISHYAHAILMNENLETLHYLNKNTHFFTSLPFYLFTFAIGAAISYKKSEVCKFLLQVFFDLPPPTGISDKDYHAHRVKSLRSPFYQAVSKNEEAVLLAILEKADYLAPKLIAGDRYRWFEACCRNNNFSFLPFFLNQGFITGREKHITKILSAYPKITEFGRILRIYEEKETMNKIVKSLKYSQDIISPNNTPDSPQSQIMRQQKRNSHKI